MSKLDQLGKYRGAALDTLIALVEHGPLDDGDVPSKGGRDDLLSLGLAAKVIVNGRDGFQAATYAGRDEYNAIFGNSDTMQEASAFRKAKIALNDAKHGSTS